MIRNAQKTNRTSLVPGLYITANPFNQPAGTARILRNMYIEKGVLRNRLYTPQFACAGSSHENTSDPVDIFNFRYYRANAPENKLLCFTAGGFIYERNSSWMQEIFPSGLTAFTTRPFYGQLGNRLFVSDGISNYVWDGRGVFKTWGFARPTAAPAVTAQNLAGGIVAATGVKGCVTWVVLDETGTRVHESSRSDASSFVTVGGADDAVRVDISALTAPSRATHWSAYISELDGSNIFRRAATTAITTTTVDISAFPASTTAKAPIRNDPPPPSTVGCVAKNRIFLRDDDAPNTFWFSALGEVRGLLNGAGEESFPGALGTSSISDLSNSDFVPDREIRAMIEHENIVFIFTESKGYALVGEMNLLDNRAPRSLVKLQQFSEGCIGPRMICSTPYGLVWMSPSRKVWLWSGGNELIDLGSPIQPILDLQSDIFAARPADFTAGGMMWYSANGKQWLMVNLRSSDWDDNTSGGTTAFNYRIMFYDFLYAVEGQSGSWFEWIALDANNDAIPTAIGQYQDEDGFVYLLMGDGTDNGIVHADADCAPAHFGHSMILGKTYLGASVQTNPAAIIRTGVLELQRGSWFTADFLEYNGAMRSFNGLYSVNFVHPAFASWVNVEDPDNPGTSIALTLDTALDSNDQRAWFKPESSGNTNVGGATCRHGIVEATIAAAAASEDIDSSGSRATPVINNIHKLAVVWHPQKETTR